MEFFNIDGRLLETAKKAEEMASEQFAKISETAEYNGNKVLSAFINNRVSEMHLKGTIGYGYNDDGRDTLEQVYADVFHTEAALVRPQIMCGTHALNIALSANLRPGDELLSPVGKPYDTMDEIIGIRPSKGSLAEYGVTYSQVDLLPDGDFDYEGIKNAINERTKLVTIQRSKGYASRPTLSVARIGELIAFIKNIRPDIICMVDNCYGEFVERIEPSEVGADMIVGSLIKIRRRLAPCGATSPVQKNVWSRRLTVYPHRGLERSRCNTRCQPVLLSGIIPCADRCCRCFKGCDFCCKCLRKVRLQGHS